VIALGTIATVRVVGPVPVAGVTCSQFPPPDVVAVAVKGTLAAVVTLTDCVCAGVVAPITYAKFSVVGAAVSACAAMTFRVTGIVSGLPAAPVEVIVTLPVYCPAASEPAFTDTWTFDGVVPFAGVAVSQLPLLLSVETATV